MQDTVYNWYASADGDSYSVGPCATRSDAIAEAMTDGLGEDSDRINNAQISVFHVCEASLLPAIRLANHIDGSDIIERINDDLSGDLLSEFDEFPYIAPTQPQIVRLDAALKAAVDAWQQEEGIVYVPHTFAHTRNEQTIRRLGNPIPILWTEEVGGSRIGTMPERGVVAAVHPKGNGKFLIYLMNDSGSMVCQEPAEYSYPEDAQAEAEIFIAGSDSRTVASIG